MKLSGKKVLLGACDTFRAAATEQLKSWSERLSLEVITGHHGSDSAAVAYDVFSAAEARACDYALIDTAGRLHVKENLMDELFKLKRVLAKRNERLLIIPGWFWMDPLELTDWNKRRFS